MKTCQEIIDELFKEQQGRVVSRGIDLQILVDILPFDLIMELSGRLYFKKCRYDTLKEYATILWFAIREKYPAEWLADWKNEAFLGQSCESNLWRCDIALDCYFRAYNSLKNPPHTLLLCIAGCDSDPIPPISLEDRIKYCKKAWEIFNSSEAARQMRMLSSESGEYKEEKKWLKIAEKLERKGVYTPVIIPNIYKKIVNLQSDQYMEE